MSSLLVAALLDAGAAVAHEVDKAKPRDADGTAVQDHREAQGSGVDLCLAAAGLHAIIVLAALPRFKKIMSVHRQPRWKRCAVS